MKNLVKNEHTVPRSAAALLVAASPPQGLSSGICAGRNDALRQPASGGFSSICKIEHGDILTTSTITSTGFARNRNLHTSPAAAGVKRPHPGIEKC